MSALGRRFCFVSLFTSVVAFTNRVSADAPNKVALLLVSISLLLVGEVAVQAQSALDGFDPNANSSVRVVVFQPDGKILIGGDFTTLTPNGGVSVTRNRIARLNPDGTLDTAFNPNASARVLTIALQPDGKILVGGSFTNIGGQIRNRIARLDATTGLADSFDPNANSFVDSIAVQADGKILVSGDFNGVNSIGGQTRYRIARLDATTGGADSFDPNADDEVASIAVQADGKILVGGAFTSIGGQTRNFIARLDPTTGAADSFNPNPNSLVQSIVVQADGKILVGGSFGQGGGTPTIGGATRNRIARLDPTTGLADSFNPNPNVTVRSIALQADGKILAGGDFTSLAPNGGASVTRNRIARLETDGRVDQTLDLSIVGSKVSATAVQPDGKILIGGHFRSVLGVARTNIARLNPDGTLDTAFNPNAHAEVVAIAVQTDGKILVGGAFSGVNSIGGATRNFIARLTTSGSVDPFIPNANGVVFAIAVQADGKILVGGDFNGTNSIGGQNRNHIARIDPTTGLADSFDPNARGEISSIVVQPDGKILVGGFFDGAVGGQNRNHIARLDPTTGLADSFNPNANNRVRCIALQADGKILVGGDFVGTNSIGGQNRNRIARLDPTTGAADSFDPNANDQVWSIAVQADGKILVGGYFNGSFTSIGGAFRNYIARLDPTTGFADSFDPNADSLIYCIAVQADGKVLVGGEFNGANSIGGQTRSFFARLSNDTAAQQNLAVSQSTITWTRGGSSPLFSIVTFESSTNNVNYIPLGNGVGAGSNWTLTGLNLLTGQNLYIRARGCHRGGANNASESIQESVSNVFLSPFVAITPPLLNIQLSANADVVLSWATNFTGFTLQSNTNLNTNVWSTVSPAPAVSGTNNVVTNATTDAQKFYRLSKP